MKILHTGDIHLKSVNDERLEAFREIINIGKRENIDVLVIAGDMFDKGINGEELRPHIRRLFEDVDFETLILPGNHDYGVFKSGLYWGKNTKVLNDYMQPYSKDDVDFWALPFEDISEEEILKRLYEINEKMDDSRTNILIFHGELVDAYGWSAGFGDEGEYRYMPIKKTYFKNTKIKYVLAGHYHTNFDVIELPNGGYFVYPGSPVSITSKETGKRKVNIFQVGEIPQEYSLSTFHYEYFEVHLDPFKEQNPIESIKEVVDKHLNIPECRIILKVSGFFNGAKYNVKEKDIEEYLIEIKNKHPELIGKTINECRDLRDIINNNIFQDFLERLKKKGYDGDVQQKITEYVIKAMMGARI